jgi:hypothetical protein
MVDAPATDTWITVRILYNGEVDVPPERFRYLLRNNVDELIHPPKSPERLQFDHSVDPEVRRISSNRSLFVGTDVVIKDPYFFISSFIGLLFAVKEAIEGEESGEILPPPEMRDEEDEEDEDPVEITTDFDQSKIEDFAINQTDIVISAEPIGRFRGPRPFMDSQIGVGVVQLSTVEGNIEQFTSEVLRIPGFEGSTLATSEVDSLPMKYFLTQTDNLTAESINEWANVTGDMPTSVIVGISERL